MRLIFLFLFPFACDAPATQAIPGAIAPSGDVLLNVDGQPLTSTMVEAVEAGFPEQQRDAIKNSGRYDDFVEQVAVGQVMYQRALDAGLHTRPEVQAQIAMATREVLGRVWLESEVEGRVGDDALRELYTEREVQFAKPSAKIKILLAPTEDSANEAKAKLEAGEAFAAVAEAHSADARMAKSGAEIGWMRLSNLPPYLEGPITEASAPTLLGPISSEQGYFVVSVEEKRDAIPFEDAKEELAAPLREEAMSEVLDGVRRDAKIDWKQRPGGAAAPHDHGAHDGHDH